MRHRAHAATVGGARAAAAGPSRGSHARLLCATPRAHDVGEDSAISEMNVDPEIEAFREHQAGAAKLSFADECRTLVDLGRYAVISTFGREHGGAREPRSPCSARPPKERSMPDSTSAKYT